MCVTYCILAFPFVPRNIALFIVIILNMHGLLKLKRFFWEKNIFPKFKNNYACSLTTHFMLLLFILYII